MREFKTSKVRWLAVLAAGFLLLMGATTVMATERNSREVHGRIVDGVRVIETSLDRFPATISVYRGDTVQLKIAGTGQPFSINIPEYKVTLSSPDGQGTAVKFKAKKLGNYPILVRFGASAGREKSGRIVVRQYESSQSAIYKEFSADQAQTFIAQNAPLILDVRTNGEYREGHLNHSVLIPVQELARRLPEIESYKNKDIVIYCRSGNRSTVAAAIMEKSGFKRLYNIRYGIIDWAKHGYPIVK